VGGQGLGVGIGAQSVQQPGAPLDIGEQEGDGACRQFACPHGGMMPRRPAEIQPEGGDDPGSGAAYPYGGFIGHQTAEYAPGDCIGARKAASTAD
jgi:hypothetical protein